MLCVVGVERGICGEREVLQFWVEVGMVVDVLLFYAELLWRRVIVVVGERGAFAFFERRLCACCRGWILLLVVQLCRRASRCAGHDFTEIVGESRPVSRAHHFQAEPRYSHSDTPQPTMPRSPSPMASALLRAQLRSAPANGHAAFIPPIRKLVLEFCQHLPSSANTRTFISKDIQRVARENPHVEFVVKQRNGHEPIARGFYGRSRPHPLAHADPPAVNGRDKVVPLQRLEVNGVERKVQLILESSGAKIKPLKKGRVVESTSESVRGIWSGVHVDTPFMV